MATIGFEPPGAKKQDIRPVGVAIAADGGRAYVALSRAERVAVIDAAARRTVGYWTAGGRPIDVALTRDGTRLLVANATSDDLTVIDTATGKTLATAKVGRSPHSIAVDD
jgi:YVTN family beta-propeller protein